MVDWNGYRILLAVIERGSFSAAARQLGTSQPTVGRQVAALEAALDTRLLVRRKRGVALTPSGERMIADLRAMAQAATDASRHASGEVDAIAGVVRVSCTESIGALWLTRRLRALAGRNPGLRFDLSIDARSVDLSLREADLAVRLVRPRQAGLVARHFGRLAFGFFASPAYLDERGVPRKLDDLARHDLIGFSDTQGGPPYERWLKRLAPRERFVLTTSGLLAQQEAARAGFGIAYAPAYLLGRDPSLRRVLPRTKTPHLDLWLVMHEDVRKNARIGVVYKAIAEWLEQEREGFADGATPQTPRRRQGGR